MRTRWVGGVSLAADRRRPSARYDAVLSKAVRAVNSSMSALFDLTRDVVTILEGRPDPVARGANKNM